VAVSGESDCPPDPGSTSGGGLLERREGGDVGYHELFQGNSALTIPRQTAQNRDALMVLWS